MNKNKNQMRITDIIKLLPCFDVPLDRPDEGYRVYVPLGDLIDVFERNNLIVVSKEV